MTLKVSKLLSPRQGILTAQSPHVKKRSIHSVSQSSSMQFKLELSAPYLSVWKLLPAVFRGPSLTRIKSGASCLQIRASTFSVFSLAPMNLRGTLFWRSPHHHCECIISPWQLNCFNNRIITSYMLCNILGS